MKKWVISEWVFIGLSIGLLIFEVLAFFGIINRSFDLWVVIPTLFFLFISLYRLRELYKQKNFEG